MIFAFCIGHEAFDGNSGHHQFGKKYMERLRKAIVWDVDHAPGGTRYVEIDGELQPTSETSELYTIANNYTFARLASFFLDKHGFVNTIVAGAHCFGMIELDFRNTGFDFYAASDHKWQCGPGATGILYVRNHGGDLPKIWPQNSCLYRVSAQSVENDRSQIKIISGLFVLRSQKNYPALQALLDACDLWEEIRGDHIETYICSLSRYLNKHEYYSFFLIGRNFGIFRAALIVIARNGPLHNNMDRITISAIRGKALPRSLNHS